jgi:MATE family multidrug resistance protein
MRNYYRRKYDDVTIGNLWVNIWRISWPMFLIMIFNFLVGFTDIYVAGFISPEVQAAVGFVGQLYFLTIIIANAISIGSLAMVSRTVGSNNFDRALNISKQSLIFSFLIAAGLTITGFIFSKQIISFAGFPLKIREISEKFFIVFAIALGSNYILIISNAIFRASGEVKKPLFTMFLVSAVNIIGDFVLVFGVFPFPKLGYIGIAFSTAISVTAGVFVNLGFFLSGRWKSIYNSPWSISAVDVKKLINIGWPAALLQIAWNAGSIVLYNILGRLGNASVIALASITNGLRIEAIIYLPAFALNMATSVLVGQNIGADKVDRAEKIGWRIALTGITLVSLMAIVIFIWAKDLAEILAKDSEVMEETTRYLRINMLSEPFMALGVVLSGGLQGAGDTKGTMWVIIIAMWLIRLPLAYMFSLIMNYGAVGVWIAMVISMTIQGLLMARRFKRGRWKAIKIY